MSSSERLGTVVCVSGRLIPFSARSLAVAFWVTQVVVSQRDVVHEVRRALPSVGSHRRDRTSHVLLQASELVRWLLDVCSTVFTAVSLRGARACEVSVETSEREGDASPLR